MSRYDKIPKLEVDWKKPYPEIVQDWHEAYFKLRRHCSDEIFRAEMLKGIAVLGWMLAVTSTCLLVIIGVTAG